MHNPQHKTRQYGILKDGKLVHSYYGSAAEVAEYLLSMQRRFPTAEWDVNLSETTEATTH